MQSNPRGFVDNGADQTGRNLPFRGSKGSVFEGGIHLPCLMRWPDVLASNSHSKQPLTTQDLFPTLADAMGVALPNPQSLDGINLWPTIQAGKVQEHPPFAIIANASAIFDGDWKLIEMSNGNQMLFHLSDDPSETHDLRSIHPSKAERLSKSLAALKKDFPPFTNQARPTRSR